MLAIGEGSHVPYPLKPHADAGCRRNRVSGGDYHCILNVAETACCRSASANSPL